MYTTGQVALAFGVSEITIKRWIKEFSKYLSDTARPARGRTRKFSDEDLKVFELISRMRRQDIVATEIHELLESGERGEVPKTLTSTHDNQQIPLAVQIEHLEGELAKERAARHDAEMARASAEGREKLLRELLAEANALLYKS